MKTSNELKTVKVSEIKPYWRNPRDNKEAVKKVKASIEKYGYQNPIIVDTENTIITGHTRYRALIELGMEEVQVLVADLDPKKAKEYRIIDNKTSEFANWDENLIFELREFTDQTVVDEFFPEFDLEGNIGEMKFGDITGASIDKAQGNLDSMFGDLSDQRDDIVTVMCPHCGEEFGISASAVDKLIAHTKKNA